LRISQALLVQHKQSRFDGLIIAHAGEVIEPYFSSCWDSLSRPQPHIRCLEVLLGVTKFEIVIKCGIGCTACKA
jgi:hypothetical protein